MLISGFNKTRRNRAKKKAAKIAARFQPAMERQPGGLRLLWLAVGLLTLTVLPHLGHIQPQIILLFVGLAAWRIAAAYVNWLPRGRWLVILFAIIAYSISAWFYGAPLGRDPGVAFLIVMLGVKCVEVRVMRDIRTLALLGLFMIMTHFLYADGISWVLPLAGLMIALIWLMAQIEHGEPRRFPLADLKMVGKLTLQALPFVIILFYLFPRLSGSLFLLQTETSTAVTGLSNSLSMGTVSNLIQSDNEAFTATFAAGEVPPHPERYWRGGVLWNTDGREWTRGGFSPFIGGQQTSAPADAFQYEINMQPSQQRWLYSLDFPLQAPDGAIMGQDYQLYRPTPVEQPYHYTIRSAPGTTNQLLSEPDHWRALQTGGTVVTPRLQALVSEFTSGTSNQGEVIQRALDHFNRNNYSYTLQPPLLTSDAPVDEFLFDSRRGFCGHYASSFATLMRLAGIPSRLVVGYLGGEHNPRSDQVVVRQSDAHAWTEVWLAGTGWQRVDPTAAVAPERIEYPIDFETSSDRDGEVLFDSRDFDGLGRLVIELTWFKDAIKAKWNRWFVSFDRDRQKQLMSTLGLDRFNLRSISIFAFVAALAALSMVSLLMLRRERIPVDPAVLAYHRFCQRMAKRGVIRKPGEGPGSFAMRAAEYFPDYRKQIDAITELYIALRYAGGNHSESHTKAQLRQLRTRVQKFSPGKPKRNKRSL